MSNKTASTFDHLDPAYQKDPLPTLSVLREQCAVSHSDKYGGFWLVTRYDDVQKVMLDPETFSSRVATLPRDLMSGPDGQPFEAPPLTSDPPHHSPMRRVLLPAFSVKQLAVWEPVVKQVAEDLLDRLVGEAELDVSLQFCRDIPIAVIARIMGLEENDRDTFARWIGMIFDDGPGAVENSGAAMAAMYGYFTQEIAKRRERPGDDLISVLMQTEVDGVKPDDHVLMSSIIVVLLAGIDTTWSSLGSALHHLARYPEDRARLVAALDTDEQLWTTAVEELLRRASPSSMVREVMKDTELGGQKLKQGELILNSFLSANHDPSVFERPDDIVLDRANNRHMVFGFGNHRCPGAHLARLEMKVGLQAFLRRYPDFTVISEDEVLYGGGQARGPRRLPICVAPKTDQG